MKVNLRVSHPANNRTKVKMAKVEGCTFFRKGDGWRHVENSCDRVDHWDWLMTLIVGTCTLIRKGLTWTHQDGECAAAKAWIEVQEKIAKIAKELKEPQYESMKDDLVKESERLKAVAKPYCLNYYAVPDYVGTCKFEMVGDVFHHLGPNCKRQEHLRDCGAHDVRVTRGGPGGKLEEFAKVAHEKIGQALATVPPNPHKHITVEV